MRKLNLKNKEIFKDYRISMLLMFIVIVTVVNFKHEIWRDEAQAWLIARDFKSISNFLYIMHYEGTPYLWHLILIPFAKLGFPLVTEKIIILIAAYASAYLIIFKSPFNNIQKVLIIFGYYSIYEYFAVSRSYGISFFLIILLASFHKYRFKRIKTYLLILYLFCNTNIHSTILGFCIFVTFAYELYENGRLKAERYKIIMCSLGFLLVVWQVMPPSDTMQSLKGIYSTDALDAYEISAYALLAAYLPIPVSKINFWNSNYLYNFATYYYGIILLGFLLQFFYKKKNIFLIMLTSTVALELFFVLKGIPGVRHTGFIYLTFLFCYWLFLEEKKENDFHVESYKKVIIYIILICHVAGAVIAVSIDFKYNFSNSKYVAQYIESNVKMDETVIMFPSSYGASVVANFKKRKSLYYLENDGQGSYTVWTQKYEDVSSSYEGLIMKKIEAYMKNNNKKEVYLILDKGLLVYDENYICSKVFEKTQSICNEDYFVYKVSLKK